MKDKWKYTINEEQRERIRKGSITKFSEEQQENLKQIAKSVQKSLEAKKTK